ncbi:MAG: hypothetical protein KJ941_01380 [Bacteroidetes bacterium]|nr:hypothetical protein [Bacteroidota bacterium]
MKFIGLFLAVVTSVISWSQTTVYLGDQKIPAKKIFEIKNGEAKKISLGAFPETIFYFDDNQIFEDRFKSKCLFTLQGGNVYRGNSTSSFDVIYQLRNGKFLLQTGDIFEKCIYSFSDNQVFIGDSKSSFDVIFSFEADKNEPIHLIVLALLIGPI